MANILGIFTAIVLAVAAFVAMKNKDRLESEIETRKNKEAVLKQAQGELFTAQETLKALPIERAGVDEQVAVKSDEEAKLKEQSEALKAEIESKTAEIAKNNAELAANPENAERLSLDQIVALLPQMKENRARREELIQTLSDKEASLANLTAQNTATQDDATRRKEEFETLSKGESLATLRTSIRSMYPSWGFVTLNDGNNAGVIAASTLNVVRDGETIARLLVTAVESHSASASIIPDSIAQDVTLMVGDRVVPSPKGKKADPN